METRVGQRPFPDDRRLVRSVVVQHWMHTKPRRCPRSIRFMDFRNSPSRCSRWWEEITVPDAISRAANRAVAFSPDVVSAARRRVRHRQDRRGPVQGLDTGFVVHAQHQRRIGGSGYRPVTAWTFSTKNGSVEISIHRRDAV
ncbi:hypothetical protein [Marinitenerispora sediminis]|uniref:Uncharacterized protein n=1 Tax=Marinitenerispora sediminis TaxID=1931232 RepID=A0A368T7T3_9ACTN|nr:hypothetical protein [Marinitenerispora sediminis]RCV53170.1 hypothetical protein DEF28_11045 [Marinitenerispora sediminis]RCV58034.1 hypothetical protein DEF24_14290 [Marinitenerispora sediminis]